MEIGCGELLEANSLKFKDLGDLAENMNNDIGAAVSGLLNDYSSKMQVLSQQISECEEILYNCEETLFGLMEEVEENATE